QNGWTTVDAGYGGTSRVHGPVVHNAAAGWLLNPPGGIATASYELFVTYQPAADRDPHADYLVLDRMGHHTTAVRINQLLTPSRASYGGSLWQSLGIFTFTQATREMPAVAVFPGLGGSISADAVLLVRLGTPVTLDDSAAVSVDSEAGPISGDGSVLDQLT